MSDKTCFVVTAIGSPGDATNKHANKVLRNLIQPVCEELGYNVVRVDQESSSGNINDSIINHLKHDHLVIADMTGHNPNAFYELGFREALNLPMIPIIHHGESLPFDVSSNRTIMYSLEVEDIDVAKNKLHEMIESFDDFIMPELKVQKHTTLNDLDNKIDNILANSSNQTINNKLDKILELLEKNTNKNFQISSGIDGIVDSKSIQAMLERSRKSTPIIGSDLKHPLLPEDRK